MAGEGYSGDGGCVEGTVVMEGGWRYSGDGGCVESVLAVCTLCCWISADLGPFPFTQLITRGCFLWPDWI